MSFNLPPGCSLRDIDPPEPEEVYCVQCGNPSQVDEDGLCSRCGGWDAEELPASPPAPDVEQWVLRASVGSLCWAYFTVEAPDRVAVLALMGATQYIDRTMPRAEAREQYRKFVAQGWTPVPLPQAHSEMPVQTLKYYIYD